MLVAHLAVDLREALLVGVAELLQPAGQLRLGVAERRALADAPGDGLQLRREGLGRVLHLLAAVVREVALGVLDLRQVAVDGLEAALHAVDCRRGDGEALELIDLLADVRPRIADRALGLVLAGLAAGAECECSKEREEQIGVGLHGLKLCRDRAPAARSESRCASSRCRPPRPAGRRAGSAGSSSERTGASRP